MASQQDLQELLRLMTAAKVPIKDAMMRVSALQAKNLRSIQQIADAPLAAVEAAVPDAKAARHLHNACKARVKNPAVSSGSKRAGADLLAQSKRLKTAAAGGEDAPAADGAAGPVSPARAEAALALPPAATADEARLRRTTLLTNRAPLVLAFAVELLRYTMPEQPPSSRLSLAQAVVSANSRSKAVAIGIEKGTGNDDDGFGHGQPKVRVLGREITVLKRGGYEWRPEDEAEPVGGRVAATEENADPSLASEGGAALSHSSKSWSASSPVTSRGSSFIVRATQITKVSQRQESLQALFAAIPNLNTASHNAWAYRVRKPDMFGSHVIREDSFDDGETGCGNFMLKIMRETNAVDTLVVMTRWYGGVMLGPDRWNIIRNCLKEALAERLRVTGAEAGTGGEAVWGIDLEAMKSNSKPAASRSHDSGVVGMPVHRPEAARAYLLKSFAQRVEEDEEPPAEGDDGEQKTPAPNNNKKKKATTKAALEAEKEDNLGRLLGALRLLYDSWAPHLTAAELDRRAWTWYTAVRPEVESGPAGWGAKGPLRLGKILDLRRTASS